MSVLFVFLCLAVSRVSRLLTSRKRCSPAKESKTMLQDEALWPETKKGQKRNIPPSGSSYVPSIFTLNPTFILQLGDACRPVSHTAGGAWPEWTPGIPTIGPPSLLTHLCLLCGLQSLPVSPVALEPGVVSPSLTAKLLGGLEHWLSK